MMRLPPFTYVGARTVAEATRVLAEHGPPDLLLNNAALMNAPSSPDTPPPKVNWLRFCSSTLNVTSSLSSPSERTSFWTSMLISHDAFGRYRGGNAANSARTSTAPCPPRFQHTNCWRASGL